MPAAWAIAQWNHARGTRVADLVLGVAEIHDKQPGKMILLDGVDSDLFWSGIVDVPFRAMEIPHVYLAPGSEARIQAPADLLVKYTLPQALALAALRINRAVVYQIDGGTLRNITTSYRTLAEATWKPEMPRFINLGDSVYAPYLGAGWDDCAGGYRLLRRAATAAIGGPRTPAEKLYIGVFRTTAFSLLVQLDGADLSPAVTERNGELTLLAAPLPAAAAGRPEISITLSNPAPDPLRFGFLEIR